jgi:hypothetical protein
MNPIHPIRWIAGALGGLTCALLACAATAPAGLASIPPPLASWVTTSA